jgi:hypothetical protein
LQYLDSERKLDASGAVPNLESLSKKPEIGRREIDLY